MVDRTAKAKMSMTNAVWPRLLACYQFHLLRPVIVIATVIVELLLIAPYPTVYLDKGLVRTGRVDGQHRFVFPVLGCLTLVSAVTRVLSVLLELMARTDSSSPSVVALKEPTNGVAL